jgi:hypothetical protein
MSSLFGNRPFGTFYESSDASDYTKQKKMQAMANPSQKTTKLSGGTNITNKKHVNPSCDVYPFPKTDLIVNLYSKEDLTGVNVVCNSNDDCANVATISTTNTPFYKYYKIDPNSQITNSACKQAPYTKYMVPDLE